MKAHIIAHETMTTHHKQFENFFFIANARIYFLAHLSSLHNINCLIKYTLNASKIKVIMKIQNTEHLKLSKTNNSNGRDQST